MSNIKQIFSLNLVILLAVTGIIFMSGCVREGLGPFEQGDELQDKVMQEDVQEEKPEKIVQQDVPMQNTQADARLAKWVKEEGIRVGGVSSSVIFKDGKYWLYYTGNGIELAISSDGLNFEDRQNVIKNGAPGSEQEMVTNPSIFKLSGNRYRMFYEGSRWAEGENGHRYQIDRKIYSAVSDDGRKWVKEDGVRFWDYGDGKPGEIFTSVPDIIQLPDGRLRMYYTRGATSAAALSNDEGLTWMKEADLKLGKVAIDLDIVLLNNGTYKLFFTTFADEFGIGEQWVVGAISTDGINFKVDENKLIEPGTPGGLVTDPDIIRVDNGYRMYYGEFKKDNYDEPVILSAFSYG